MEALKLCVAAGAEACQMVVPILAEELERHQHSNAETQPSRSRSRKPILDLPQRCVLRERRLRRGVRVTCHRYSNLTHVLGVEAWVRRAGDTAQAHVVHTPVIPRRVVSLSDGRGLRIRSLEKNGATQRNRGPDRGVVALRAHAERRCILALPNEKARVPAFGNR